MPDVTTIMAQVAPIGAQISLVMPDVSTKMPGFSIVSVPHCPPRLPPVLVNITPVSANVSPVMTPVNSVPTKVSSVGAQVDALAQSKRRSQHSQHRPTYDSSSHHRLPSLSGLMASGKLEHRVTRKVLETAQLPGRPTHMPDQTLENGKKVANTRTIVLQGLSLADNHSSRKSRTAFRTPASSQYWWPHPSSITSNCAFRACANSIAGPGVTV